MNFKKRLCAAFLALVPFAALSQTAVNAPAAPIAAAADKSETNAPAAAVQDEKQICETLKKTLQGKLGIPVDSVSVTPVKGVYEVVAQNEIMYSDATADHIIVGQLFETKTQRNLTAETKDRLSRIDFAKLPLADAIKIVNGTGARQIAVFSDPNCSFCRKLEASLKEMKDVTIYTVLPLWLKVRIFGALRTKELPGERACLTAFRHRQRVLTVMSLRLSAISP